MSLTHAIEAHREAQQQVDHWERVCASWEALCGPGVWAEGHPFDLDKLYWRDEWRRRRDAVAATLAARLSEAPPGGCA